MSFEERNKHLSGAQLYSIASRIQSIQDNPDNLDTRMTELRTQLQSVGTSTVEAIEVKSELYELQRFKMELNGDDPDQLATGAVEGNGAYAGYGGYSSAADRELYEADQKKAE